MSSINGRPGKKLYRLWALPLLALGAKFLTDAWGTGSARAALLGLGALCVAAFAIRHNLFDTSPTAVDPKQLGALWVGILILGALLLFAAAVVRLAA